MYSVLNTEENETKSPKELINPFNIQCIFFF